MLKCRIYCTVLQKCNIRTNFCERFALILNENLTHVVFFHAACWPFYRRKQAHTFLTLQKSRFWARIHMISLHARVRKPFQKKCEKTGPGVPPERASIWYPYIGIFCALGWRCKKKATPEREYIWYPYTRGSENPSKKSVKKLVRASLLSELLYDIRKLGSFVHFVDVAKKRPLLSENT